VLFKLVDRSVGLISTIVLARLLVPSDFGLVALAAALIGAAELLGAFSFDVTLIHRVDTTRSHFDTAWSLNILFGAACAILLALAAVPAASFYGDPRLAWIILVLGSGLLVQPFENVGVVAFRKDLAFEREFTYLLAKRLLSFGVTLSLAFWLKSYWALVAGTLTGRFFGVGLSYIVHPYRPRFSLSAAPDLLHFSKWLAATNVILFFGQRIPDFIIGKVAGPHALGLYSVSYEISNLPTTEIVAPINRAVFPGYAKIHLDRDILRRSFLKVLGMIATLAVPAAAGMVAISDLLVPVVLGPKWLEAVPFVKVLALYGGLQAIQTNIGPLLLAQGKARVVAVLTATHLTVLVCLLAVLIPVHGANGAAWSVLLTLVLMTPVNCLVAVRSLEMRLNDLGSVFVRPLIAGVGMYFVVDLVKNSMSLPAFAKLMTCVVLGVVVYSFALVAAWGLQGKPAGPESYLWRTARIWLASNVLWRRGG
jgi:lipopolysaccharide exporter